MAPAEGYLRAIEAEFRFGMQSPDIPALICL